MLAIFFDFDKFHVSVTIEYHIIFLRLSNIEYHIIFLITQIPGQ